MKYLKTFNEARKEANSLNTDVGLFIYENSLTLYNPKTDEVIAYIGLEETIVDGKKVVIHALSVAAEKGYGPLIYELAMMYSDESGLMLARDGDIRGGAFEVWEKFYDSNRRDIRKETLPLHDRHFTFAIFHGEEETYSTPEHPGTISMKEKEFEEHIKQGNKKIILVYNTKMYMDKTDSYNRLVSIANGWFKRGINQKDINDKGRDFFSYRYEE